jgi:hypothetical protein
MTEPQLPDPVKLFVAILWSDASILPDTVRRLEEAWGPVDFVGPDRPFDLTDYYLAEMGPGLQRRLLAFEQLVSPETICAAKLFCFVLEKALSRDGRRRVNLDAGYLDHNKVVLASFKKAGQKIYLEEGIYADLVARYKAGRYQPFEWTFPDFKAGRYDAELAAIRRQYLEQLRGRSSPNNGNLPSP